MKVSHSRFQQFLALGTILPLALLSLHPGVADGAPGGTSTVNSTSTSTVTTGGVAPVNGLRSSVGAAGSNRSSVNPGTGNASRLSGAPHPLMPTYSAPRPVSTGYAIGGVSPYPRQTLPAARMSRYNAPGAFAPSSSVSSRQPNADSRRYNAWTDPATARNFSATNTSHSLVSGRGIYQDRDPSNHNFSGTILYPGAYGYRQNSPTGTSDYNRPSRSRHGSGHHGWRDAYNILNCYAHTGFYYPYFGNSFGGDFPYYSGVYTSAGFDDSYLSSDFPIPTTNTTDRSNLTDEMPAADRQAPDPLLPDPPAVGPRTPADSPTQSAIAGPDSLVEAVQNELTKRGYVGGKVDAIYGADTRAALQRFQADQDLPVTGRINEATLHALQLD